MIKWVDFGLGWWSNFYRDKYSELGYPSCSAEAREFGGGSGMSSVENIPEVVVLMESAVLSMDGDMQLMVKVAYMNNSEREDQAKYLSRKLDKRISRQRLGELISASHVYIEGYARAANPDCVTRILRELN